MAAGPQVDTDRAHDTGKTSRVLPDSESGSTDDTPALRAYNEDGVERPVVV